MSEFPRNIPFPPPFVIINTFGTNSIGSIDTRAGLVASNAWPVANLAIYVPFRISAPMIFNTLFCMNGATVSGNVDMAVYTSDGTRLVSVGGVAQSGTSAIQSFSVTSTEIGTGQFYIAIAFDNTTATIHAQSLSATASAALLACIGLAQQATAYTLPSTATFASYGQSIIPFVGLTNRSFI